MRLNIVWSSVTQAYDLSGLQRGANARVQLANEGSTLYLLDSDTREVTSATATVAHDRSDVEIAYDAQLHSAELAKAVIPPPTPMAGCTVAEVAIIAATIPATVAYIAAANT